MRLFGDPARRPAAALSARMMRIPTSIPFHALPRFVSIFQTAHSDTPPFPFRVAYSPGVAARAGRPPAACRGPRSLPGCAAARRRERNETISNRANRLEREAVKDEAPRAVPPTLRCQRAAARGGRCRGPVRLACTETPPYRVPRASRPEGRAGRSTFDRWRHDRGAPGRGTRIRTPTTCRAARHRGSGGGGARRGKHVTTRRVAGHPSRGDPWRRPGKREIPNSEVSKEYGQRCAHRSNGRIFQGLYSFRSPSWGETPSVPQPPVYPAVRCVAVERGGAGGAAFGEGRSACSKA